MKKWKLLPKLAKQGIVSNKMLYYPYMIAGIFTVFTYFVFASILRNDLMSILPHRAYAWIILEMGKNLLRIILFCFLIYAGSFVTKRRKKEIGLYSLLGLEKKHIGIMLFWETLMIYAITEAGGMILGTVLSKLFFLLLLKLSKLSLHVEFALTGGAFMETLAYFGVVFSFNFLNQLYQVGKFRPTELMGESRKGEKEPRFLAIWSIVGVTVLGLGYFTSIRSKDDSMILINFFFAVFLVIIGTYLVFTSGSVFVLKLIRHSKKLYYRPANFITVSGMFYRMKKSAAGLVNICIFSTMVLITLICTLTVYFGLGDVAYHNCPYDVMIEYAQESISEDAAAKEVEMLKEKYGVEIERADLYDVIYLSCKKDGNCFQLTTDPSGADTYRVMITTLETYNHLMKTEETLAEEEILIYSTGVDFGYETLEFMGIKSSVKGEVEEFVPYPKARQNRFDQSYIIIARDDAARDNYVRAWAGQNGVEDMESFLKSGRQHLGVLLEGEDAKKAAFVDELTGWCHMQNGFVSEQNGLTGRAEIYSMYGGLLFIGVIFGVDFFLCLLIIMYYKQVSEGYEDQINFAIMQKVGMSEEEIKSTVHKQIFMVFGLPLLGALLHTAAGMFMVKNLMFLINFYNTALMLWCVLGVSAVFILIYGSSYLKSAKTYYRIVNRTVS